MMKPSLAILQVRLDTFIAKSKTRRSSSRSSTSRAKKAAPKNNIWPLSAPSPQDLAFAGFHWAPSSSSPDNVKCVYCDCQLDGWEEFDVPAHEHLTHSPNCGFAINICIRLRTGDPSRVEEDPLSDKMKEAREATFGDYWPLDTAAGFPSVEQMVAAGWCYDPALETPDAVTCSYCSLSLDSWDAGDDPAQEHVKRAPECLFFTLKELYHPTPVVQPPKKTRKRASSRAKPIAPAPAKRAPVPTPPTPEPPAKLRNVIHEPPQTLNSPTPEPPQNLKSPTPEPQNLKSPTPEPSRKRKTPVPAQSRKRKSSTPAQSRKRKSSTPAQSRKRKSSTPAQSRKRKSPTPEKPAKRKSEAVEVLEDAQPVKKAKLFGTELELTGSELDMTVEGWIRHNAEQATQHLRGELEQQIQEFDIQGKLALEKVDAMPVY